MKRALQFFAVFIMVIIPLSSLAQDNTNPLRVKIGSMFFNLFSDGTAETTCLSEVSTNNGKYVSGDLVIPETIMYDDNTYTVVGIGAHSFWGCYNLLSIQFPRSITYIGDWAFSSCTALRKIEIPSTIHAIGEDAFYHCKRLKEVSLPASVNIIGKSVFSYCDSLECIVLPESIKEIPQFAFSNCKALRSISLPSKLETIHEQAFTECVSLETINIPGSVTSIGNRAFSNCKKLTSVYLKDGKDMLTIGMHTFSSTPISTLYLGRDYAPTYDENTKLDAFPFYNKQSLTELQIGPLVTTLPKYAFYGCSSLKEVDLMNVTNIGYGAFKWCSSLNVNLMNVTNIGDYAFQWCRALSNTLNKNITHIGDNAFDGCDFHGELSFNEALQYIGVNAFRENINLTKVELCNSFAEIGSCAFMYCSGLITVNLGTATKIGACAFEGCSKLTEVVIPNTVTGSVSSAFMDCDNLSKVEIGSGVSSIARSFFGCKALKTVIIRDSKESLYDCDLYGNGAFNNSTVETLYLGRNLVSKQRHFNNFYEDTELVSLTIGEQVTEIQDNQFYGCSKIKNIYSLALTPPICQAKSSLEGISRKNCTLHVPLKAIEDYKKAEYWKEFYNIMPIYEDEPQEIVLASSSEDTKGDIFADGLHLNMGESYEVEVKILPETACQDYTLTSSDPTRVVVDNHKLTVINPTQEINTNSRSNDNSVIITINAGSLSRDFAVIIDDFSNINDIMADDEEVHYYNLQGIPLKAPVQGQICIRIQGNKATKIKM